MMIFKLKFAGWAALAALLMGPAAPAAAACKLNMIAEFKMRMIEGWPAVDAVVNDKPTALLLSTSAALNVVYEDQTGYLGINQTKADGIKVYSRKGVAVGEHAFLKTVNLGALHLHNVDVLVAPTSTILPPEISGSIGGAFFDEADVEFDFAHNAVRLFKPDGCVGDEVLYWGGAYAMLLLESQEGVFHTDDIEGEIDGKTVSARLATGAIASRITRAGAIKLGAIGPGDALSREGFVKTFNTVSFDQEVLKTVPIRVSDPLLHFRELDHPEPSLGSRLSAKNDGPDMILGSDFFLSHRVFISQSQKKVYFTYAGGAPFDSKAPRLDSK